MKRSWSALKVNFYRLVYIAVDDRINYLSVQISALGRKSDESPFELTCDILGSPDSPAIRAMDHLLDIKYRDTRNGISS